ncbi:MAG TPA: hypothetical protein VKA49_16655, partial [Flavitalea sp.]|nr:hypothetical protein [Flavitalea sp.]
ACQYNVGCKMRDVMRNLDIPCTMYDVGWNKPKISGISWTHPYTHKPSMPRHEASVRACVTEYNFTRHIPHPTSRIQIVAGTS